MKSFLRILSFSLLIALIDQGTKYLAKTYLEPLRSVSIIPGFFNLSYVENIGAAWGMLAGKQIFLILFTIITLGWFIWKRDKLFGKLPMSGLIQCLLFGGIIGNLIDRLTTGRVIDFLDFHWGASHFPSFNIADSAICCGVFLFLLFQWRADRSSNKAKKKEVTEQSIHE